MAQGAVKKSKATAAKRNGASLGPKRGTNSKIAPKRASLIRAKLITHKHSAGKTAATERILAEKAGHLELLRGGKREKGKAKGGADGKAKVEAKKA